MYIVLANQLVTNAAPPRITTATMMFRRVSFSLCVLCDSLCVLCG
jgi:hypothetical protein